MDMHSGLTCPSEVLSFLAILTVLCRDLDYLGAGLVRSRTPYGYMFTRRSNFLKYRHIATARLVPECDPP